jgi:cytochrome o ubiquinol oxidase subunit 2
MRRQFLVNALALVALFAVLWIYGGQSDLPLINTAGPIAAGEREVMFLVVEYAAIIVIPVWIMLFLFAWVFREGADVRTRAQFPDLDRYGSIPELVWWSVPAIIIGILSVVSWQTSHSLDPYEPLTGHGTPLEVQVIALDWKWLFIYPAEGVATVNQLTIPVGRPIHFFLTADAPMNSFWIPQLAGQVMVMPGMSTQLWLRADREGVFDGYSANLSGEGFASMHFKTNAVPESDFDAWLMQAQASSTPLSTERYEELSSPSAPVPPAKFSPVVPGLYQGAIESFIMPHTTTL